MFILGTICCRHGSKGIPGKNYSILNGRPLLHYTFDAANQCHFIDELIVSTDSEMVADLAKEAGIDVPFKRPAHLSTDTASKWEVFKHAAVFYEKRNRKKIDYLVDMDVTVPLKTAEDIEGAIKMALSDPAIDVVITAYEPERNPYFNMMEADENGWAKIVKSSDQIITCRQQSPKVFSLSPAAYVVRKEALFKFSHWSKANCKLYIIPRERALDIDTIDDLNYINFLIRNEAAAF